MDWDGVAGKRVVITGATSGIGLAAAQELARRGAELTLVARSPERARAAAQRIPRPVDVVIGDFASLRSVRQVAEELLQRYPRMQVLINNAGAIYATRQLSADGIELTWAVNHLAPFLLTMLLLERIEQSAPARIITTASAAHYRAHLPFEDLQAERSYTSMGFGRYGETKLANIMFTRELAQRLHGTGVTANCFHPGFVGTGFGHNNGLLMRVAMILGRLVARTPDKGAETLVWLADSLDVSDVSGAYFMDRRQRRPSQAARDHAAARKLWGISEQQTARAAIR